MIRKKKLWKVEMVEEGLGCRSDLDAKLVNAAAVA